MRGRIKVQHPHGEKFQRLFPDDFFEMYSVSVIIK